MEYVLFVAQNAPHLKKVTFGSPVGMGDHTHVAFEADNAAGVVVKGPRGMKIRWIWGAP